MPQNSIPIRSYVFGFTFGVSVEDPYRDLWYCFEQLAWVAPAAVRQRYLVVPPATDPGYETVVSGSINCAGWPDGNYVLYGHNLDTDDSIVFGPPLSLRVVAGTTQWLPLVALAVGANVTVTSRDNPNALPTHWQALVSSNVSERF